MFRIILTKKLVPEETKFSEEKWIIHLISNDYKRDEKIISHIADKCSCEYWFKTGYYKEKIQFLLHFKSEANFNKCIKFLGRCHLYDKSLGGNLYV